MNINRHNYEEFFLLYVDKELTAPQLAEVEVFLEQNPDLRQELEMLQQAVLSENSEIAFANKDLLYKTEQGINHQNYEEYFLLYVDNELEEAEKVEVEKFVLQHPSLQETFTILRATKLHPELLTFKNKESLYRREQNERVIPLKWFRMAAAAAVIGFVALIWFKGSNTEKTTTSPNLAHEKVRPKADTPGINGSPNSGAQQLAKTDHPHSGTQDDDKKAAQAAALPEKTVASTKKKTDDKSLQVKRVTDDLSTPDETNTFAAAQTIVAQENKKNVLSADGPESKNNAPIVSRPVAVSSIDNNPQLRQAVYRETMEEEDERSIYIGGAEINRNKLRGLFKKAAGIFDKKGKKADEDNTVQIASFEIKTK